MALSERLVLGELLDAVIKVVIVRNTSCGKVVFTGVCLSTGGVHIRPRQTPRGRHPPNPQQTAITADGTHPTGMHSCLRARSH